MAAVVKYIKWQEREIEKRRIDREGEEEGEEEESCVLRQSRGGRPGPVISRFSSTDQ